MVPTILYHRLNALQCSIKTERFGANTPLYFQMLFALEEVKHLAPQHPE